MLQRSGSVDADGNAVRAPRPAPAAKTREERPSIPEYVGQVRSELRKVAWPTRGEVQNYTIVVIITLAIMTLLTFGYDYVFAKAVLFLLDR